MKITSRRDLAAVVRARRHELGWSQEELAQRTGVSRWWISALEGGKSNAHLVLVLRTLETLGLGVEVAPAADAAGGRAPATLTVDLDALLEQHTRGEASP